MHGLKGTIRIYCDFDGTVTDADVGDAFFEQFSGREMWVDNAHYKNRVISAGELYLRNAARIRNLTAARIAAFCSLYSVHPTFPAFVQWSNERAYPCIILSDGFDVYISKILDAAGVQIPFRANEFSLNDDGTCEVRFPYSFPECKCSANCKRNHLLLNSGDDDFIVYIGDGVSDFCPAQYADLVFAKGALETFCQRENITFRRFFSFNDVRTVLDEMTSKKRLRKPLRARLLRNSAWMSG